MDSMRRIALPLALLLVLLSIAACKKEKEEPSSVGVALKYFFSPHEGMSLEKVARTIDIISHPEQIMTKAKWEAAVHFLFSEESITQVQKVALNNIHFGICDTSPCTPATEEEKANPPLSRDETAKVMQMGKVSAIAQHCGLDWKNQNFLPMMRYWREDMKKSHRQLALIGIIHGIVQGNSLPELEAGNSCSKRKREAIQERLPFKP